jgi:arginine utilization protein RocB
VAIGKETHASDPFLGLDANLLISAIIQEIVGNPSYTEVANGISTPVPISLKLENPKRQYSVKTNKMAMTSINIITYTKSIDEWMAMIKQGVSAAVKDLFEKRNEQYKIYCENNNIEYKELETDFDVLFVKDIQKHNINNSYKDTFEILNEITFDKSTIIIHLSSPYYPAHVTTNTDQKFVESIMTSLQKNYINHMMVLPYYPYISDLSFLKSPSAEILQQVKNHSFDETIIDDQLWNIAKDLNIAMANIGPYGFDAHKDGERLESSSLSWVYSVIKDILIR